MHMQASSTPACDIVFGLLVTIFIDKSSYFVFWVIKEKHEISIYYNYIVFTRWLI